MNVDKERIERLLELFEGRELTANELNELSKIVETQPDLIEGAIQNRLVNQDTNGRNTSSVNWEEVIDAVTTIDKPQKLILHKAKNKAIKWIAAASIILIGSVGAYYYRVNTTLQRNIFAADITPGKNKATLKLSSGKIISLTDIGKGSITEDMGVSISKTEDGQIVYEANEQTDKNKIQNNTISTPSGGQWQIKLPDGTQVWLNALSSLTYPTSFNGKNERRITLSGEAYFEVSKNEQQPFIVETEKQDVKVLGTHFNVSAYADEPLVKTTLLEGSVQVTQAGNKATYILKPGEQSELSSVGIKIEEVDAEDAIAWKNGYFIFNNERQESIMQKIARWYDVEVTYADSEAKNVTYLGTVSRFENVSQVLRKFQKTGEVRFEIDGRKIIVYKAK